jgi:hypothetical protein
MTKPQITDDSPGSALFPEFDTLYHLITAETDGLTDEQLDWTAADYGWAEWSIRVQLSHMASLIYRWLILRWGDTTFPDGEHGIEDVNGLAASPFDRRMDDTKYYDLPVVMAKLREGIDLARRVLAERSVGFLRSHTVTVTLDGGWALMIQAHPAGVVATEQPNTVMMQLEGSIRHIYFEEITHLFNIQRLKRAQGLPTLSDLPRVGYWTLDDWDVSEAQ